VPQNYFDKYRTVTQWIAAAVREAGICVVGHVQNHHSSSRALPMATRWIIRRL